MDILVVEGRVRALEENLVRITTYIEEARAFNARFFPKLEALIESRSGDAEQDRTLVRDVGAAHQKLREQGDRLDRMEKRQLAMYWLLVGAMAVINVVSRGLPSGWLEAFKP